MSGRCVLLAAGLSRRWGEENKLLFPVDGKPMYQHGLALLEGLRDRLLVEPVVVTRYEPIQAECRRRSVRCVWNPHSEEGISSSLRLGLTDVAADWTAFFVADQPYLTLRTAQSFLTAFAQSGKPLGTVTVGGKDGNPRVFAKDCYPELRALCGDRGGRALFSEREHIFRWEVPAEELQDLDTKAKKESS